ncbi:MAG: 60S ribosomal protein L27 [Amphiamblys sp. WSBS2006]|nr:MAG: 60S ribosomal protein L27 [Amphiamblys sp. WSBS2006]
MENQVLCEKMVVIVQCGRQAGKKAFVHRLCARDDECTFESAIVVGVEKGPKKAYVGMSEKKIQKRSRVYPFVKKMNVTHLIPTTHFSEIALGEEIEKGLSEWKKNPAVRKKTIKELKKTFEEDYASGRSTWLFKKLQMAE